MSQKRAGDVFKSMAVVAAVVTIAAGCGARVSRAQVDASQMVRGAGVQQSAAGESQSDAGGSVLPGAPQAAAGGGPAAASGTSANAATAEVAARPEDNGGATDVGVTGTTIRLGTVVTLSGPIPGLFAGSVAGMQAWAAYQNSLGGINGRKITLDIRDDQFDTGQNRSQTSDAVTKDFALVGSFSTNDDGGAEAIEKANVASIQVPLTARLEQSPNNFSINPVERGAPTGPWNLFKEKFPAAVTNAAGLYTDVAASKENYLNNKFAMESVGYKFVYERGIQPTETDFTADVVRMRSAGVKFFFTNTDNKTVARIAKAMQAQNLKVDAFTVFGSAYDGAFPALAGSAGEGLFNIAGQAMYLGEDAGVNPEVRLFNTWLEKVKPGFHPDLMAAYGWGAGRLFGKAALDAGPKITRASLLAALRKIDSWNGYGLFPDAGPATKRPAVCFVIETLHEGKFERWNSPPPGFNCANSAFLRRP